MGQGTRRQSGGVLSSSMNQDILPQNPTRVQQKIVEGRTEVTEALEEGWVVEQVWVERGYSSNVGPGTGHACNETTCYLVKMSDGLIASLDHKEKNRLAKAKEDDAERRRLRVLAVNRRLENKAIEPEGARA